MMSCRDGLKMLKGVSNELKMRQRIVLCDPSKDLAREQLKLSALEQELSLLEIAINTMECCNNRCPSIFYQKN